ncbi:MAG: serine/threonine protein kinase [Myxococcaceae bacterium]|nr:serine/threonine protein kinase [Myxococcaceae bacterium]
MAATLGVAAPLYAFVQLGAAKLGWVSLLPHVWIALGGGIFFCVLWVVLRLGLYHPLVSPLGVLGLISLPPLAIAADLQQTGLEGAWTSVAPAAWPMLVMLTGFRASQRGAVAAGLVAGGQHLALCEYIRGQVSVEGHPSMAALQIGGRTFILVLCGVFAALMADYFVRQAQRAMSELREHDLLGKYLLDERVGAGGMAEVFRATYSPEGGFAKSVAIKRVLPGYALDERFVRLFRREAELGATLAHPNIVQVFDMGSSRDTYFLAMEFVDGAPLSKVLAGGLESAAVVWLAHELAQALDYLERRTNRRGEPEPLVHRDLNPPNVLVSRYGEVKLSDFGIAKALGEASHTQGGAVRGKFRYLAPEQVDGRPIDGRVDLFALGLTLHEALTGRPAIDGASDAEVIRQLLDTERARPSATVAGVHPGLERVVMHLLERDPARRSQTAAQVLADLAALEDGSGLLSRGRLALGRAVERVLAPAPAGALGPTDAVAGDLARRSG